MLSNTLHRVVEWGDCDPAGIVFNPQFFRWFDHGTTMLYEAAGWPKQEMLARFNSPGCPLVSTSATFHAPSSYGDHVEIRSEIFEVKNRSFVIRHTLTKDGTLCVEGNETRVWTARNEDGKIVSAPLPEELARRFRGE